MQSNPYQSLVSLLSNILEAYTTAFFIVDPKNRLLNMVAAQSLSRHIAENISLPMEQSGILSQVHKAGQTIHIEKVSEISSTLSSKVPFYREGESHIKGLFAVPVGDGAGVLYVDTKYSWSFNDKQQKWIREIAAVLNELLQRQTLLAQQRSYAHILDFWHRLDKSASEGFHLEDYCQLVVDESARFLGTDYGFLSLRESEDAHYQLFAATPNVPRSLLNQTQLVKHGLIGWILQNHKNLFISRLNPQTEDHFLFSPSEGLPHHGTFWGLPMQTSLGHSIVIAFLSRDPMEWTADDQFAISHVLHFFHTLLEEHYFKEECQHLRAYDLITGIQNALTFETSVDAAFTASMQNSSPLTLSIVQVEPWEVLCTKSSPKQVREWQRELASCLCQGLPSGVLIGQIAENRFGLVFPGISPHEVDYHLSNLTNQVNKLTAAKIKGTRLQPYAASVGCPQDGTRSEELWPLAYRRLFATFRPKGEKAST